MEAETALHRQGIAYTDFGSKTRTQMRVTVDERWIYYYTPENRMIARQWTETVTIATKQLREAKWVGFLGFLYSSWTTLKRENRSTASIVVHYWSN